MRYLETELPRRGALLLMIGVAAIAIHAPARAAAKPRPPILVHRDAGCGCCGLWAKYLERAGFKVTIENAERMRPIKQRLGVPDDLASCHTAEMVGYVIEGHVPLHAIERLLAEKPKATGLAVPGMPIGSPGMEGGAPEVYEVILFGPEGQRSYGKYKVDRSA